MNNRSRDRNLGKEIGIVITTILVSQLCASKFLGGWPSAFYVFGRESLHFSIFIQWRSSGVLCCLWFIGWCFFAYNSPSEHPRITYSEKLYLLRCIPKSKKVISNNPTLGKLHLFSFQSATPWSQIFKCVPLYGIAVQHICTNFIFYILLTSLPTYFSTILRFNLQQVNERID